MPRSLRDRLRRRPGAAAGAGAGTAGGSTGGEDGVDPPGSPCTTCGDQAALRPFSVNPDPAGESWPILPGDGDVLAPGPLVSAAAVADRVVVLDRGRGVTHVLNASAGLVLAAVDGERPVGEVIAVVAQEVGLTRRAVADDTRAVLGALVDKGVLVPASDLGVDPDGGPAGDPASDPSPASGSDPGGAAGAGPGPLVLHAGAVERDGRAVVVVGASGRGKSTLTAALVRAGFALLADERVAVDPATRSVVPDPQAVHLDDESLALLGVPGSHPPGRRGKAAVDPGLIGATSDGGRLALLVLLADQEGPGAPGDSAPSELERLEPVDALLGLVTSTFPESFGHPDAFDALAALATDTPVVRLHRCPLPEAVGAVTRALG